MKFDKKHIWSFVLLIVIAALYRIIPSRPGGFAPQIAMALFAGSVISDKKISFLFPLLSMFLSDAFYQLLYVNHLTSISGFYSGQVTNYLLFIALTIIGFGVNKNKATHIFVGSLSAATVYFLASNFLVWIGGGFGINNLPYTKNIAGLLQCYTAAIPFYLNSIYATLLFSGVLFGAHYFIAKFSLNKAKI
jgi:hypothetical protein